MAIPANLAFVGFTRAGNLNAMYEMREKRYLRFADYIIDNNRALEDTVEDIRKVIL